MAKTIREVERKVSSKEIIEAFFPEEVGTIPKRDRQIYISTKEYTDQSVKITAKWEIE